MPVDERYLPAPDVQLTHPDWCRNGTVYQINTRQFTPEGTFDAAAAHLPRLKELGVSILWLMPVQPIGERNRKGGLGSPYSVRDYYGVNPELGTAEDLRAFVAAAHEQGFHVILDWVANHTAWDCSLVAEHPEWYARDYKGDLTPTPWWDWDDIIDLDYRRPELRQYMTEAMVHWVREFDLDGFRCDVAGFVPTDFWETARRELERVKPVFLLAEWESRDLHRAAFDMSYAWSWNEHLHAIAHGEADVELLRIYYSWDYKAWPDDSIRMMFVSNHDHNAWEGTEYERFGDAVEAAIVLSVVGRGMPLVHNGQEAGLRRRLQFFDRDPIEWREDPMAGFYSRLIALRCDVPALWGGSWGAHMVDVPNDAPRRVFSFVRSDERHRVLALFNFSAEPVTTQLGQNLYPGHYRDFATAELVQLPPGEPVELPAWGWRVLLATGEPYVP